MLAATLQLISLKAEVKMGETSPTSVDVDGSSAFPHDNLQKAFRKGT